MGIFLLVCAGLMFKTSLDYGYYGKYGPGPGFFPVWISGGLIILSILYILESVKQTGHSFAEIFPQGRDFSYMLTVIVSISALILMIDYTGYIVAGIIMLLLLFRREYQWHWAIGLSVVTALCLYVVFQVFLKIPLPQSAFF